jgi:hypothetical protein
MEDPTPEQPPPPQLLMISSHVVNGTFSAAIFSLILFIGGKRGLALVDSGSTDTFLDYTFARKLNCNIASTHPKRVKVARGGYLDTNVVISPTSYVIQDEILQNDFKLLQLKGYEVILGCDWIKRHSPIELDLRDAPKTMVIHKEGQQRAVFQDFKAPPKQSHITTIKLEKFCRNDILGYVIQINAIQDEQSTQSTIPLSQDISDVLLEFEDVFSPKTTVLPQRNCHHQIPLAEGSKPPIVKPYSIPHKQDDELETLIKDMLRDSTIRPSNNPYASPAILVRKKDGSWRMCIDYRELNSQTMKDTFSIPVIDDLLDELFGTIIFTKLDLKGGYHKIRMKESDIHKIAFKTYLGHYEFLVMPFGQTNAPSTFHALMNQIFSIS